MDVQVSEVKTPSIQTASEQVMLPDLRLEDGVLAPLRELPSFIFIGFTTLCIATLPIPM